MNVISLKLSFNESLKRTQFDASGSFEELAKLICAAFPALSQEQFTVKFEDDESELCTISSTVELLEAVSVTRDLKRPCLKLFLESTGVQVQPEDKTFQARPQATEPQANPQAASERQTKPETKTGAQDQMPNDIVITLLIDFLTDEKIVSALPQALELFAQQLPEVKDVASADQLVDMVLSSCPAIANHELVQSKLPEIRPCLLHKIVRMATHSDKVALVMPQLLIVLPQLLRTAPAVLLEVLEGMEKAEEQGDNSPCHMAPIFKYLMPMVAPIIFNAFGQCGGMRGGLRGHGWCGPNSMNGPGAFFMPNFFGGMNTCAAPSPSPSAAPDAAPDASAHQGIHCDVCKQNPIQGTRFKCTVCHDFDLCAGCEEKGVHPAHHALIKIRVPERKDVHHNVACDGCNVSPITGNRFKCTVCPNFDLCATCEFKNIHPADHPLIKMREASSGRGPFGGHGRRGFFGRRGGWGHGRGRGFGGHCGGGRRDRRGGFGGRRGGHGMRRFWEAMMQAGQERQEQQQQQTEADVPSAPSQPVNQVSEAPQFIQTAVVSQPQEPQEEEPADMVPYDVQLNVLTSMGFPDRARNLCILQRFNGELPRTIDHLINH